MLQSDRGHHPALQSDRGPHPALQSDRGSYPALQLDRGPYSALQSDREPHPALQSDRGSHPALQSDRGPYPALQSDRGPYLALQFDRRPHPAVRKGTSPCSQKRDLTLSLTRRITLPCGLPGNPEGNRKETHSAGDPDMENHKRGGKKGKGRNKMGNSSDHTSRAGRQAAEAASDETKTHLVAASAESGRLEEGEATGHWSLLQVAVTGALSAVYVSTMHPTLPGGDAGELIVAANELGVAHPPGYPLFTVMLKAFFLVVPYGTVAWRANLLTSLLAAGAGGFLFQAVFVLTGSCAGALLAAGMFSVSSLTWAWAVTAEVFALNNLLLAALLLTAVCFSHHKHRKPWVSQVGALLCGLCLSNQHTAVVYVAVLAPWVLVSLYRDKTLSLTLLVKLALCFLLGLTPYAHLPLSSARGLARWTWGDQSSLPGFLTHLLRREYGTLSLLKDHEGQGLLAGLSAYIEHVTRDLTPAILFFFATSVFSIYKRRREGQCEMMLVMLTMLTSYTVFFAWRANLDIANPLLKGVVERFWLQSDLVLVAMAGVAFSDVIRIVNRLVPLLKYHMDVLIACILITMHLMMNVSECDQSGNRVVEDFALSALKAFPPGAIVLTKGDLPSNSFRYYHLAEGVRPDLVLFDQEVLTYDWSVPMLGPHASGLVFPGRQMYLRSGVNAQGTKLFTFKELLDSNYDKGPIFGCIGVQDHEPSWQATYDLRPFGVCSQFLKKGSKFTKVKDWLKASHQFAANWSHPIALSESTWEDVALGEMWRAKTVAGLYILETADTVSDRTERAALLQHAYQVYRAAIESHPHVPGYWHKNFALVCEKLRHLSGDAAEKLRLIRTTIAHFKAYLDSGTLDPQVKAIQEAVQQLEQYVLSVAASAEGT